jgi:hypothetical protein
MAAPSHAVTIRRAAEILGEDEELLWDLVDQMEPEDGRLWIYDTDDKHTIAFTDWGLENLREILAEHKRSRPPPRP